MFIKALEHSKKRATDTQQQQCLFVLSTIMPLFTNEVFLACSMSKDGPEGAIFGIWH